MNTIHSINQCLVPSLSTMSSIMWQHNYINPGEVTTLWQLHLRPEVVMLQIAIFT